jgi:hypothetical protein
MPELNKGDKMSKKILFIKISGIFITLLFLATAFAGAAFALSMKSPKAGDRWKGGESVNYVTLYTTNTYKVKRVIIYYKIKKNGSWPNDWDKLKDKRNLSIQLTAYQEKVITNVPFSLPAINNQIKIYVLAIKKSNGDEKEATSGAFTLDSAAPANPNSFTVNPASDSTEVLDSNEWYTYKRPRIKWAYSPTKPSDIKRFFVGLGKIKGQPPIIEVSESAAYEHVPPSDLNSSGEYYFMTQTEDTAYSLIGDGNVSPIKTANDGPIYRLDVTSPSTHILTQTGRVNSDSFTLNWEGNDYGYSSIESYDVEYKTPSMGDYAPWITTTETSADFTGALNGETYMFRVRATDSAKPSGNIGSWSPSISITVDTSSPSSIITQPNTSPVETLSPRIVWNGSDNLPGTLMYLIQYKDITTDSNAPWQDWYNGASAQKLFTEAENNHTYCFRSRATDSAGNTEDWPLNPDGDFTFTIVAGDAPTNLNITTPYDDNTPTFMWDAPNEALGYAVSFEAEPGEGAVDIWAPSTTYTTDVIDALDDGEHTFYVRSYYLDNITEVWSGSVGISFLIDTQNPAVTSLMPEQLGSTINITGEAVDATRIKEIKYRIRKNGAVFADWSTGGTYDSDTVNYSISETLSDGTYTFDVKAIDVADHESAVLSSNPITISIQSPAITLNVGGANVFTLDSIDPPIIVDPNPHISVSIVDGNDIFSSSLSIFKIVSAGEVLVDQVDIGGGASPHTGSYDFANELEEGIYRISVVADDEAGYSSTLNIIIEVHSGGLKVLSRPYNYPNPFRPGTDSITIKYELSRDSNTRLLVYDLAGNPVRTFNFAAGQNGGKAGDNTPVWDGKNNFGQRVPNGPYLYFIIVNGKVIGRGEMAAYK